MRSAGSAGQACHIMLAASLFCAGGCRTSRELEFGSGLDVPYVQTPPHVVTAMLKMAHVTPSDVVMDLGCGDGRIVIAAAREFGARAIGYDIDPKRIAEARANATAAGVAARVRFEQKDFFHVSLSEASVITAFLTPLVLEQFRPHFLSDLAPGSRVVSHSFPMQGWKADERLQIEGRTLYLFTVPAHAN